MPESCPHTNPKRPGFVAFSDQSPARCGYKAFNTFSERKRRFQFLWRGTKGPSILFCVIHLLLCNFFTFRLSISRFTRQYLSPHFDLKNVSDRNIILVVLNTNTVAAEKRRTIRQPLEKQSFSVLFSREYDHNLLL